MYAISHEEISPVLGTDRCAHYAGDLVATAWLEVRSLQQDVLVVLHDVDEYAAHTAVRHMASLPSSPHTVYIAMPPKLRKARAFTPWFRHGRTVGPRDTRIIDLSTPDKRLQRSTVLAFASKNRHVHSAPGPGPHHQASFGVRVGGKAITALFDTGATCCCMHKQAAESMGLAVQPASDAPLTGLGGTAQVLGAVHAPVKIGKSQESQRFLVLDSPIAGYDVLIGQDYMLQVGCAIRISTSGCQLEIGHDPAQLLARVHRPIHAGREVFRDSAYVLHDATKDVGSVEHSLSKAAYDREMRAVLAGKQVAYTVTLQDLKPEQEDSVIPSGIQTVIDKHSSPGGTLAGDIPYGRTATGFEMHIDLVPGARPVRRRQYRLTPLESEALISKTKEFHERGWIEPSTSSWNSPVLFVPKPNGTLRFCVDFRELNARTDVSAAPIADQRDVLDSLHGASIFTALDLCSGFYQIPLAKDSREFTAFSTPQGLFQWCVMPMGLSESPGVFQAAMTDVLREHINNGYCKVYLDDVLIFSKDPEDHARHLDAVLTSLTKHSFFCQLPKCEFALTQLRYLGHLVSGAGVQPDPKKVSALSKWVPPLEAVTELQDDATSSRHAQVLRSRIVKQTRSFLGFMQYFSRFIPRFSTMAAVLFDQVKDNAPAWSDECTMRWEQLKQCLQRATLMYHPDFALPFHVYFDASLRGIGGLLVQEVEAIMCPIAFCARGLQPAELNYTTTEQEFLAMVHCFQVWRCYLEGSRVFAHTDHEPLTWLATQKSLNRRQARWMEFLSRFKYELLYIKGDKNVCADALSRMLGLAPADLRLPGEVWPHEPADSVLAYSSPSRRVVVAGARCCFGYSAAAQRHNVGRSYCAANVAAAAARHRHSVLLGGHTRARARAAATPTHGSRGEGTGHPAKKGVQPSQQREALSLPPSKVSRTSTSKNVRENSLRKDMNLGDSTDSSSAEPTHSRAPEQAASGSSEQSVPCDIPPDQAGDGFDHSLSQQADHLSEHEKLYDTLFTRIRDALLTDSETASDSQRQRLSLEEIDGLLWQKHKLYIPDKDRLRQDVLYWHHDVPWACHLGIEKTVKMVAHQFFWPGMSEDIRKYVASCVPCQKNKTDRRRRTPPLSPLIAPESCWRTLGVDLITDLPKSDEGYDAICVFVCHLSKMCRLVPTTVDLTTVGFARLFVREVFPHYGFPLRIVSDRGHQWNSEFFKSICERAGITLCLSTAYHPQTNGLVERTNEPVAAALRSFVAPNLKDWPDSLSFVEFALNASYHDAIKTTPFAMNRIALPLNPFDVLLDRTHQLETDQASWLGPPSGAHSYAKAHQEYQRARRCVHDAKARMKHQHDGKGVHDRVYNVNDLVWFNVRNLGLRHDSRRHKLLPKFWGPFKVIRVIGRNAVHLDMPSHLRHIHPVVSVSLIKPFVARLGQPPPVEICGEDEHELESVIDFHLIKSNKRNVPNQVEFKVQWKGSFHDTWHSPEDFGNAQDVLVEFLSQLTKNDQKSVLRAFDSDSLSRLPSEWQLKAQ